jgi:hypothetical protein
VTALDRKSIEASDEPVDIIPALNCPDRYDACVELVVMAKEPLYPNDGVEVVSSVELPVIVPAAVNAPMLAVVMLAARAKPPVPEPLNTIAPVGLTTVTTFILAVPALLITAAEPDVVKNDPAKRPPLLSTLATPDVVNCEPASNPPLLKTPYARVFELLSTLTRLLPTVALTS